MGSAGFPPNLRQSELAAKSIRDTFLKYGFVIHENAYSNYSSTSATFASLLALGGTESEPTDLGTGRDALFAFLSDRGYRVASYYSSYIDLCGQPMDMSRCTEYPANSVAALRQAEMPWQDRFLLVAASQANSFGGLGALTGRLWPRYHKYSVGPLSISASWREFVDDVLGGTAGVAHLAHFMIPHGPYVYRPDGSLRPVMQWRMSEHLTPEERGTDLYNQLHGAYADQVLYLNGQLDQFFRSLTKAGLLDSMLIIVHGDHGSRTLGFRGDPSMRRTILEAHSILFAVRSPGPHAGRIVEEPAGLLTLVINSLANLGEKPQVPEGNFIVLDSGQLAGEALKPFLEYLVSQKP